MTMMMKLFVLAVMAADAQAFVVPAMIPTRCAVAATLPTVKMQWNFKEAMAGFTSLFGQKPSATVPTAAEVEEYCRDQESTGCDLEMIDRLMAERKQTKTNVEKSRAALGDVVDNPPSWTS